MAATTFYSKNFVGWPPVPLAQFTNPNSAHWRERCLAVVERFDDRAPAHLTKAEWEWLGNTIAAHLGEAATWQQYYDAYQAALEALKPGVTVQAIAYAAGVLPEGPEDAGGARCAAFACAHDETECRELLESGAVVRVDGEHRPAEPAGPEVALVQLGACACGYGDCPICSGHEHDPDW
jgi:hypothetical protein